MNNSEKPIPILRGKEINTQKLIEILKQKLSMLENWHAEIGKKIKDKRALFNRELMMPGEKRNYGLIAELEAEIKILNDAANKIFDEMESANDLLQEGKENLMSEEKLSALIEDIIALEQKIKEENT